MSFVFTIIFISNLWSLVSIFILSWSRVPTIAYLSLGLNGIQDFLISIFLTLKPYNDCCKVRCILRRANSYVYKKFWKMCLCMWSWCDLKYRFIFSCSFLVLFSSQYINFTFFSLTLVGYNLPTEFFLLVQVDWCWISQNLSTWVSGCHASVKEKKARHLP